MGRLWNQIVSLRLTQGIMAGLAACIAYDVFRVPFVMMKAAGVESSFALPLFKVMPGFGAMILDQAMKPGSYNWLTHLLGWTYHFSNGIGFGIMYVAAIGNPLKHHWLWGVMMAVGLEAAMLLMPYASLFAIRVTPQFVTVTLAAHLVFGAVLGLSVRWLAGNLKR